VRTSELDLMNRSRDNGWHDIVVQLAGRPGLGRPARTE
jgi:hypothetical protein